MDPTRPAAFDRSTDPMSTLRMPAEARVDWSDDRKYAGAGLRIRRGTFRDGAARGVEVIAVDTGVSQHWLLPTRGMSIWRIDVAPLDEAPEQTVSPIGWRSPVAGPVHPALVPLIEPSGLGWLSGFDELLVRCGLTSNGPPLFNEAGQLTDPLHGRIGNTPAQNVHLRIDGDRLIVTAEMVEARLFFGRLRLSTTMSFQSGSPNVHITDRLINDSSTSATAQMLYHINVGRPILGDGSRLRATLKEVAPKDSLSAGEMDQRFDYGPPTSGYRERVYFAEARSDDDGWADAMVDDPSHRVGLGVRYQTDTLPKFVVWKNTADVRDGYVTGMEPATNFPNAKPYEAEHGRVLTLEPEQEVIFWLDLQPLLGSASVNEFAKRCQSAASPVVHDRPQPTWSPQADA